MPETQPTAAEQLAAIDHEMGERKIIAYNLSRQRKQLKKFIAEHEDRIDELARVRPAVAEKAKAEADKAPVPEVKADPAGAAQAVAKRGRPPKSRIADDEPKPLAETNGQAVNA